MDADCVESENFHCCDVHDWKNTEMRTVWCVCVCSQGGSGSTRPVLNLDSSRVLIPPTSHSPAFLLCAYRQHRLFSTLFCPFHGAPISCLGFR